MRRGHRNLRLDIDVRGDDEVGLVIYQALYEGEPATTPEREASFRGVVFDIDPVFANSEEWYESIPEEIRPPREQPFYHLLAENEDSSYVAYVSQGNLVADPQGGPVDHPTVRQLFDSFKDGRYRMRASLTH